VVRKKCDRKVASLHLGEMQSSVATRLFLYLFYASRRDATIARMVASLRDANERFGNAVCYKALHPLRDAGRATTGYCCFSSLQSQTARIHHRHSLWSRPYKRCRLFYPFTSNGSAFRRP